MGKVNIMMLITKEIARKLHKADQQFIETGETPNAVILKLFAPWGRATWWIVQATPLDAVNGEPCEPENAKDWHMYGFADVVSADCAELGYTLLSELKKIHGPYGLTVERDRYYGAHTLSEIRGRDEYNYPRNANVVTQDQDIDETRPKAIHT